MQPGRFREAVGEDRRFRLSRHGPSSRFGEVSRRSRPEIQSLLIQETRTNKVKTNTARDTFAPHKNADGSIALERVSPPL
ncbi:MAG: hypothetical protein DMF65_10040 [Acidobacteria bacterium]|nr:MAG: hypothetical protein DMF65_10040 [Acidobacteriota bacterium]